MNETPGTMNTMNMDLGQNILEKSLLMFSEAKASWVYTRLAHKKCPNLTVCTLFSYKVASKLKKSVIIFIFIPLSSKPSSLYVSNSTFPSPQKKNNNEYHWIIALQSWIKVGYIGDHLCSGAYTLVRNMEVRRVVATLPWAFDELWLRSILFRKQNQDCVGIRIEV